MNKCWFYLLCRMNPEDVKKLDMYCDYVNTATYFNKYIVGHMEAHLRSKFINFGMEFRNISSGIFIILGEEFNLIQEIVG